MCGNVAGGCLGYICHGHLVADAAGDERAVVAREGNWVKISQPVFGFCNVWDDEGHQILEKGDFSTVAKFRYRVVVRGE